jgi:hypothetical protein
MDDLSRKVGLLGPAEALSCSQVPDQCSNTTAADQGAGSKLTKVRTHSQSTGVNPDLGLRFLSLVPYTWPDYIAARPYRSSYFEQRICPRIGKIYCSSLENDRGSAMHGCKLLRTLITSNRVNDSDALKNIFEILHQPTIICMTWQIFSPATLHGNSYRRAHLQGAT